MTSDTSNVTRLSLLRRIRCDDSCAWNDLVELYGPLISYWCREHGLDREIARDCVQEVFFSVLKSIDRYAPGSHRGSFRSWLWTIARHKIIDFQRQQRRQPVARGGSSAHRVTHQLAATEEISDLEVSDAAQLNLLLHRGLRQVQAEFEDKTWQAFWRTVIDNIPASLVANDLGISIGAVRQYRSRVLRRLRQQIGDLP